MIKWIASSIFKLWGFKVTGIDPETIPKKLYIVYPHTSNWDFPVGILMKFGIPINVNYIAKDSLFKWPYGFIFRKLGGIPVNRKERTNFVDTMVNMYKKHERLAFAMAPEGTRKKVRKFKTGFYYIAHNAQIPIIMVKFDWGNKLVDYSEPFYTSGVYRDDLKRIINHFRGTIGHTPENACQWEDEDI